MPVNGEGGFGDVPLGWMAKRKMGQSSMAVLGTSVYGFSCHASETSPCWPKECHRSGFQGKRLFGEFCLASFSIRAAGGKKGILKM